MEYSKVSAWIISAALIAGSIVGSTVIASNTLLKAKAQDNNLSVTGSAEQIVRSDTAKWTCTVTRSVETAKLNEAGSLIKSDMASLTKLFTDRGITATDMTVNPMTVSVVCESQENTNYDYSGSKSCAGNKTTGYLLTQTVTVQSSDVDKLTKLAQETPEQILAKNIVFTSTPIEYYYNQLADLRITMLAKATENAKARAQQIAVSSGAKLGAIQSASMGVFQVTSKNSADVSDYGAYDTTSIEKKITAIVRSSFQME